MHVLDAKFFRVNRPDIVNAWLGLVAGYIRTAFAARAAPATMQVEVHETMTSNLEP